MLLEELLIRKNLGYWNLKTWNNDTTITLEGCRVFN